MTTRLNATCLIHWYELDWTMLCPHIVQSCYQPWTIFFPFIFSSIAQCCWQVWTVWTAQHCLKWKTPTKKGSFFFSEIYHSLHDLYYKRFFKCLRWFIIAMFLLLFFSVVRQMFYEESPFSKRLLQLLMKIFTSLSLYLEEQPSPRQNSELNGTTPQLCQGKCEVDPKLHPDLFSRWCFNPCKWVKGEIEMRK